MLVLGAVALGLAAWGYVSAEAVINTARRGPSELDTVQFHNVDAIGPISAIAGALLVGLATIRT
jgi:hypothetical protein